MISGLKERGLFEVVRLDWQAIIKQSLYLNIFIY